MTNRPRGVLYTGVTTDIGRRAFEHREAQLKASQADMACGDWSSTKNTRYLWMLCSGRKTSSTVKEMEDRIDREDESKLG
jgi:hypothetical protein